MTTPRKRRRPVDAILADIEQAGEAAAELIGRGRQAWDNDVLLRLAGEAVIGRIADATNRLPEEIKGSIHDVPWDDIRDIRILVDHIYHRIDYNSLWQTLHDDVPHLVSRLREWRA
ncbi:hypothetical protein BH18ACT15_BH18ACT15_06670 [soil metagenome]